MKKMIICLITIILIIVSVIVINKAKSFNKSENIVENISRNTTEVEKVISNNNEVEKTNVEEKQKEENNIEDKVEENNMIYLKVNNQTLEVELENNAATEKLVEKLQNEDVVIDASEYGGFEKVGNLGFSLPREDSNIKTTAGDIVLYQGNQISVFYNSHSWSYTKIGRIQNASSSELETILGNGDVTLTFTTNK
jgi:hypothetical protein